MVKIDNARLFGKGKHDCLFVQFDLKLSCIYFVGCSYYRKIMKELQIVIIWSSISNIKKQLGNLHT